MERDRLGLRVTRVCQGGRVGGFLFDPLAPRGDRGFSWVDSLQERERKRNGGCVRSGSRLGAPSVLRAVGTLQVPDTTGPSEHALYPAVTFTEDAEAGHTTGDGAACLVKPTQRTQSMQVILRGSSVQSQQLPFATAHATPQSTVHQSIHPSDQPSASMSSHPAGKLEQMSVQRGRGRAGVGD